MTQTDITPDVVALLPEIEAVETARETISFDEYGARKALRLLNYYSDLLGRSATALRTLSAELEEVERVKETGTSATFAFYAAKAENGFCNIPVRVAEDMSLAHSALVSRANRLQERLDEAEKVVEERVCVNCGRRRSTSEERNTPHPECPSPDACIWDMTPDEAWQYWRQRYHDLRGTMQAKPTLPAEGEREPVANAYIIHCPADGIYGIGPPRLQFHTLSQHDLDDGYRQTPLYTHPAPQPDSAQRVDREKIYNIITDALDSAIPEPWEVADHATARILSALERPGRDG